MTQEEFVDLLSRVARANAVDDVVERLAQDGGSSDDMSAPRWFRELPPGERHMAKQAMDMVAYHVVRSVLDVLDGIVKVEPVGQVGHFELAYVDPAGARSELEGRRHRLLNELLV